MKTIFVAVVLVGFCGASIAGPSAREELKEYLAMGAEQGGVFSQGTMDGVDYRKLLAGAIAKERPSLAGIFRYTAHGKLMGEGADSNADILRLLLTHWGDRAFARVLAAEPEDVRSDVIKSIDYMWVLPGWPPRRFPVTWRLSDHASAVQTVSDAGEVPGYLTDTMITSRSGRTQMICRKADDGRRRYEILSPHHRGKYTLPAIEADEVRWDEPSREPAFYFHQSDRKLIRIQRTSSGTPIAILYTLSKTGRYTNVHEGTTLDRLAGDFFNQVQGFEGSLIKRNREGCEFIGWEKDGETLQLELSGRQVDGEYSVQRWRVHYNFRSERFFLTGDDRACNDEKGVRWRDPESGGFTLRDRKQRN